MYQFIFLSFSELDSKLSKKHFCHKFLFFNRFTPTYIQIGQNWEVNFLTFVFLVGNVQKIYQKPRISVCCCNSSCSAGQKLMK